MELRKPHKLSVTGLSRGCVTMYMVLLWKRYRTACYGADQQQFDVKPATAENMATLSLLSANGEPAANSTLLFLRSREES